MFYRSDDYETSSKASLIHALLVKYNELENILFCDKTKKLYKMVDYYVCVFCYAFIVVALGRQESTHSPFWNLSMASFEKGEPGIFH